MKACLESETVTRNSAMGAWALGLVLLSAPLSLNAQVSVDDQSDRLEALKIELEEARRTRDKVIAKRWDDRRLDMEAREKFNQEYDEIKSRLEAKNIEADRLHEESQNMLKDAEEVEAHAEDARIRFSTISGILFEKLKEMSGQLEKGFPAKIPLRLQKFNQALKAAEVKKDAPSEVLSAYTDLYRDEHALTREVILERGEFLRANQIPAEGPLLRLGTVISAYRDGKTGMVGLLLKKETPSGKSFEWREDLTPSISDVLAKNMEKLAGPEAKEEMARIPMDVLLSQSIPKTYTLSEKKSAWQTVKDLFKAGGIFMWPLTLIPIIALLLLLERLVTWLRVSRGPGAPAMGAILKKAEEGKFDEAVKLADGHPRSLVLGVIRTVLRSRHKSRDAAEKDLQEMMLHEVPRLERRLTTISVLGAAAPLLGLLGTVSGLIHMFETITLHGTNDPKLLAGGISEALVTTEFGLIIAIPVMLAHNFISNRMDGVIAGMESQGVKTMNTLWPQG